MCIRHRVCFYLLYPTVRKSPKYSRTLHVTQAALVLLEAPATMRRLLRLFAAAWMATTRADTLGFFAANLYLLAFFTQANIRF